MYNHKTVLLKETVDNLNVKENGIYVDATFGGGGHSKYLLSKFKNLKLFVFDQDIDAIENGKRIFKDEPRIHFINSNFKNIKSKLFELGIYKVNGILADLGVSSYQLDTKDRGFSFRFDSNLDMRMNQSSGKTAKDVVNTYSKEELAKILKDYGEENWAQKIASVIVDQRKLKPINTTFELVNIIEKAVPKKLRDKNKHVATRTFQAIRIEVNDEIQVLKDFIKDGFSILDKNGRMSIITFHSIEDRVVKSQFKDLVGGCICPKEFPVCVCGKKEEGKIITRKPILPSDLEILENNRSRSAKLRVIEKIV